MEGVAAREMRLARLLLISGLAARAVADAAADGDSPSRWSFRALTGIGRDDGAPAAAAAAAADAASTQNVANVRLWFSFVQKHVDDLSLFQGFTNMTKFNESHWARAKINHKPGGYYGPWDERNQLRDEQRQKDVADDRCPAGTPRPHAEQPRAVDGVGVSRCFFAGVS